MQWNIFWQYECEFKPAGLEPGTTNFKPIMSSPQSFQNSDAIWLDTKTRRQKASSLPNQVSCGTLWWAFSWQTAPFPDNGKEHTAFFYWLTVMPASLSSMQCSTSENVVMTLAQDTVFIFSAFFYQTTINSPKSIRIVQHTPFFNHPIPITPCPWPWSRIISANSPFSQKNRQFNALKRLMSE